MSHSRAPGREKPDATIPTQTRESDSLLEELRAIRAAPTASEERLALAFDASGVLGWWDWDVQSDIFHASERFARMHGVDSEHAAKGVPFSAFVAGIHPDDREHVDTSIEQALAHGGEFAEDYRPVAADGPETWVHARGRCYLDAEGQPARFPGVALDITETKRSERRKLALVKLGDRLRDVEDVEAIARIAAEVMAATLGATRAGFGIVDEASETVLIQPDWRAPGTTSLAGRHRFRDYGSFIDDLKRGENVVIGDVSADPRTSGSAQALLDLGIRVLVNLPIMDRGRFALVVFVHHDLPHDWTKVELNFVRTVGDRAQAAIARTRAEEQRRLVHQELAHRLKNNLAMVQAIASQTLRNAPDLEAARKTLGERLAALNRAHGLVLSAEAGDRGDAEIRAIVNDALALHDDGEKRIRLQGPFVEIGSAASLALSLMLHELATNAVKYGALSVPEGQVDVRWRIRDGEAENMFEFEWRERGGPPVTPPERQGFGSRLIERGLTGTMGGEVDLDYACGGVVCRLRAPSRGLGAAGLHR